MPAEADAVYFAPKDYASILRRLIAFLIDLIAVLLIYVVVYMVTALVILPKDVRDMPKTPENTHVMNAHMKPHARSMGWIWLGLTVAYHILLRTTRGGTLGYRLTRIRLVDMTGRVPVLKALLRRFLLAVPGCLMFGATYLNCLRNPARRAGHDQWSGTWLVRTRAEPAGPARPVYQTRLFGTFLLTFADIEPATDEEDASEPENDGGIKSNEQDAIL